MVTQLSLKLFGRIDAPCVVPTAYVKRCKTYREAVRMCFALRRVHNLTQRMLAYQADLRPQLVTDYLNADDLPSRRDLPANRIAAFESVCGNTLVTQWLSRQQALTCLEQMQADQQMA